LAQGCRFRSATPGGVPGTRNGRETEEAGRPLACAGGFSGCTHQPQAVGRNRHDGPGRRDPVRATEVRWANRAAVAQRPASRRLVIDQRVDSEGNSERGGEKLVWGARRLAGELLSGIDCRTGKCLEAPLPRRLVATTGKRCASVAPDQANQVG